PGSPPAPRRPPGRPPGPPPASAPAPPARPAVPPRPPRAIVPRAQRRSRARRRQGACCATLRGLAPEQRPIHRQRQHSGVVGLQVQVAPTRTAAILAALAERW